MFKKSNLSIDWLTRQLKTVYQFGKCLFCDTNSPPIPWKIRTRFRMVIRISISLKNVRTNLNHLTISHWNWVASRFSFVLALWWGFRLSWRIVFFFLFVFPSFVFVCAISLYSIISTIYSMKSSVKSYLLHIATFHRIKCCCFCCFFFLLLTQNFTDGIRFANRTTKVILNTKQKKNCSTKINTFCDFFLFHLRHLSLSLRSFMILCMVWLCSFSSCLVLSCLKYIEKSREILCGKARILFNRRWQQL